MCHKFLDHRNEMLCLQNGTEDFNTVLVCEVARCHINGSVSKDVHNMLPEYVWL